MVPSTLTHIELAAQKIASEASSARRLMIFTESQPDVVQADAAIWIKGNISRTEEGFVALAAALGFRVERITPEPSVTGVQLAAAE